MTGPIRLVVSIDTEEDNWRPVRRDITVRNAARLPAMHRFLDDLGLRPTYFVDHPVAVDADGAAVLRELAASGTAEIGAHLHPWNTPPIEEALEPRNTMLGNLPVDLQRRKLEGLGRALEAAVGFRPTAFRAGRFGTSAATLRLLVEAGYTADSSVMPWTSWAADFGPDFRRAPINVYAPDLDADPCTPAAHGPIAEVPLSAGYTRRPFAPRDRVRGWLLAAPGAGSRLGGVASRLGLARHVILSPETDTAADMLQTAAGLVGEGARHLQVFWHSPSWLPGLTPFVRDERELETLRGRLRGLVEGLRQRFEIVSATVGEVAEAWRSGAADGGSKAGVAS